jgi:molecular chaperone GrpE (heat shock protein)
LKDIGEYMEKEAYESIIINMSIENWRLARLFLKAAAKLEPSETNKYINQLRYFQKNIENNLDECGLKIVNIEGQVFDIGMAAVAMNMEDFDADDILIVESMIEPIIMGSDGIKKQGTVMLKKANV